VKLVQPEPPLETTALRREIADHLERLEQQFSTYRPNSTVSRFNAARHTDWFPVEPEVAHVAAESRAISELTAGAFDVTVFPLVRLWGFGGMQRTNSLPGDDAIAATRALVDWRQLEVRSSPPAFRKVDARVEADFSSMAKGFAADAISGRLKALGVMNHLVQIGGDVKSAGSHRGDGWRVGVEQPDSESRAVALVVALRGKALSTAGNYRNFIELNGKKFGHIIDPRTGRPAAGALVAVTVVEDSCARSSALATALLVLGSDEGLQLATREGLAAVFLLYGERGVVPHATDAFEELVDRVSEKTADER
jgi:thiamine biosynthesis lipoprotein